jgi:hypothetical protein
MTGTTADGDFFDNLDRGYQGWGIVPETSAPYQSMPVTTIAQVVLDSGRLWTRFAADFIKPWDSSKGASQAQLDRAIARSRISIRISPWRSAAGGRRVPAGAPRKSAGSTS